MGGWKDPRTSLTMAFWKRHCPEMNVVLCVRNPLEVARSLHRRQGFSPQLSMNLWYRYNTNVVEQTARARIIVTHYESYFRDPQAELRRVLRFLDMPHSDETIAESCAAISGGLRHHQFTAAQLRATGVSPLVRDLYDALAERAAFADPSEDAPMHRDWPAGHGGERTIPRPPTGNGATLQVGTLDVDTLDTMVVRDELAAVRQQLAESVITAEGLFADLVSQGAYVREVESKLATMDDAVHEQGTYVQRLETDLKKAGGDIDAQGTYLRTLETDLREAYETMRGQGAYVRELETGLASMDEAVRQQGTYVRELEGKLAVMDEAVREQGVYVRTLETDLAQAGKDIDTQGAYVRTLEADLRAAYELMRTQGEYVQKLEDDVRALNEAIAAQGEYVHKLETDLRDVWAARH
ncbi:MAG: sulfotransferase [Thermomicrobiales bacterium]